MNSDVAESRPRTKTPAAKEFEIIEIAGRFLCKTEKLLSSRIVKFNIKNLHFKY